MIEITIFLLSAILVVVLYIFNRRLDYYKNQANNRLLDNELLRTIIKDESNLNGTFLTDECIDKKINNYILNNIIDDNEKWCRYSKNIEEMMPSFFDTFNPFNDDYVKIETTDIDDSTESKILDFDDYFESINDKKEIKINFKKDPRANLDFKIYIVNEKEMLAYSDIICYSIKSKIRVFLKYDVNHTDVQFIFYNEILKTMMLILKEDIGFFIPSDYINEYGVNLEITNKVNVLQRRSINIYDKNGKFISRD